MLNQDIRQRITDYLTGTLSVQDLNKWVGEVTWDVQNSGDTEAERLTGKVELWLAELSHGHLSEDELKRELYHLLRGTIRLSFYVGLTEPQVRTRTAAAASTTYSQQVLGYSSLSWQPAAKSDVEEYV